MIISGVIFLLLQVGQTAVFTVTTTGTITSFSYQVCSFCKTFTLHIIDTSSFKPYAGIVTNVFLFLTFRRFNIGLVDFVVILFALSSST